MRDGTPSSIVEEYLLGELAQVHPITRALSGTPPSTRQVVGEIVAIGVLATLEARMRFGGGREKDHIYNTRGV